MRIKATLSEETTSFGSHCLVKNSPQEAFLRMFFLLSYQCDRAFSLHRTENYLSVKK